MAIDKEKILAGREAVDAYREAHRLLHLKPWHRGVPQEHTPLLNKLRDTLADLDFNSEQEFHLANEQLCYREVQRCYKAHGTCDGCEGRQRGCIEKCFQERVAPLHGGYRKKWWTDFYDWQQFEGHIPPGCSFGYEQINIPTFDIYWGMPKGIDPAHYKKIKEAEDDTSSA